MTDASLLPATAFVVLHHGNPGPGRKDHWDLMIQWKQKLITFEVPEDSILGPQVNTVTAIRLPDHRLHYLDYEGPISGNRGFVRRIHRGCCQPETPPVFLPDPATAQPCHDYETSRLAWAIHFSDSKTLGRIDFFLKSSSPNEFSLQWTPTG